MKNNWYAIEVCCIKEKAGISARLNERKVVAKVESCGLAYVTAKAISEVMGDCFSVSYHKIDED